MHLAYVQILWITIGHIQPDCARLEWQWMLKIPNWGHISHVKSIPQSLSPDDATYDTARIFKIEELMKHTCHPRCTL